MFFLAKLVLALCGLYGVVLWFATTPSGSYGAYLMQLVVVVSIMLVFVFFREDIPSRIHRPQYNQRKKMIH